MRLFYIALAGASIIVTATPAVAQSYYARHQVATKQAPSTVPTPTPTPTPPPTWVVGEWGNFSSECSVASVRTRSVVCTGHNGASLSDANCATAKPESTESEQRLGGCTYAATYGTFSACVNGSQSAPIASCTRSDGTPMTLSTCSKQVETRPCTVVQGTCPSLSSDRWYQGGTVTILGNVTTRSAAQAMCTQHITGTSRTGICAWELNNPTGVTENRPVYFVEGATMYSPGTRTGSFIAYAAMCQ